MASESNHAPGPTVRPLTSQRKVRSTAFGWHAQDVAWRTKTQHTNWASWAAEVLEKEADRLLRGE